MPANLRSSRNFLSPHPPAIHTWMLWLKACLQKQVFVEHIMQAQQHGYRLLFYFLNRDGKKEKGIEHITHTQADQAGQFIIGIISQTAPNRVVDIEPCCKPGGWEKQHTQLGIWRSFRNVSRYSQTT